MPLDEVGRRLADTIFRKSQIELPERQQLELSRLANKHASRGSILSGSYATDYCDLIVKGIDELARAKLNGLLSAYHQSGLPFDEAVFQEIKSELVDFCQLQQHNAIGSLPTTIRQISGVADQPPGSLKVASNGIISGVTQIISRIACDLEIKRDEVILDNRKIKKAYAAGLGKQWDVFICHASEDKQRFVRSLAEALRSSGLSVWYDEFSLKVGDSLRRAIDDGLANSRYGVVVLSHSFFAKNWTQHELDGLMSKEVAGNKVILPVWHGITVDEVRSHSPMLAGLVAAQSSEELTKVVQNLREAMGLADALTFGHSEDNRSAHSGRDESYTKISTLMPQLLAEMRKDLSEAPLAREFIVISKVVAYWYDPNKKIFTYYFEDHPELDGKLRILENFGFVRDVRFNQVPRFVMEEKFVDYLTTSER
jgi:TIR domain